MHIKYTWDMYGFKSLLVARQRVALLLDFGVLFEGSFTEKTIAPKYFLRRKSTSYLQNWYTDGHPLVDSF